MLAHAQPKEHVPPASERFAELAAALGYDENTLVEPPHEDDESSETPGHT